jgi:DNA recombination protein RmuC
MNVIIIALLVVAIALLAVNMRRSQATTGPSGTTLSQKDIEAALAASQNQALTQIMDQLRRERDAANEEARKAQAEQLRQATDLIVQQGSNQFGTKADAIDQTLRQVAEQMALKMKEIDTALGDLRESSSRQFGTVEQAVTALSKRTENLNEILSSAQARGQWGERLAEDMLRAAGFVEGINYRKQGTIDGGGRPDYRFDMPPDRVLFMDVKFPLDKYAEYVAAQNDIQRTTAKADFVRAVKGHVDALARRDYIDKSAENSIDYVLMFVPNESISGFVHEADPNLIDYALSKKVVLCSPLTLYAFLVVIRQASDSFHTEKTSVEIMQYINLFFKQWESYVQAVEKVRKSFATLTDDLESIDTNGTRFKMLNAQIKKIERLRTKQGIPELPASAADDSVDDNDGE